MEEQKDKELVLDQDLIEDIDTNKDGEVDAKEAFQYVLHSRTIWVNVLALLAMLIQQKFGYVVDAPLQMEILTVVNLVLRGVTNKPLVFRKQA